MLLNLQIQMKLKHSEILAQAALNFISAGHHFAFLNKSLMQLDNITMPRYLSQPISILLPNVDAPIQNSKWCGQALLPLSYPLFMPRKEPAYRQLKHFQALSGIRTQDLCDASVVLSQLSYQSYMRAVVHVYGLALYMGTFRLGPSTVKMKVICPIVATE